MKQVLGEEELTEAIQMYMRHKEFVMLRNMEVDEVEFQYNKKAHEVEAIVVLKERKDMARYNDELLDELDFEKLDIIRELDKGGTIELSESTRIPKALEEFS